MLRYMKPIVAITMGDPGGVGPEIILKSIPFIQSQKVMTLLVGSADVFQFASKKLDISFHPHVVPTLDRSLLRDDAINLLDVSSEAEIVYKKTGLKAKSGPLEIGKISAWNGSLAYVSFKIAAHQAAHGLVSALVTAPVNKEAIRFAEPEFTGHTEFLARIANVQDFAMMFVSERLKVTLVTIHLPLKSVSKNLNQDDIVKKIELTSNFLKRYIKIKNPHIGVSALNPHGREFGTEEESIISPAVKRAQQKGISVSGPMPGDQIFYEAYEGKLDAVVAMYHDQGLAPFKMINFHDGVNVTLGLPYLRTSPDHGTAFDIAYQNKANPTSFQNAYKLAAHALL